MGKKSLRRRVARQQSKSNDPPTSETIKSILDRRVESIAVELATFPSSWNEGCGKVLARLIRFWTEGRGKEPELGGYRYELALDVASICSEHSLRTRLDLLERFMRKMINHINVGEIKLARLWMLTFHVLVHGSASDIEAEMMDSLNGITEIQNNDKELVRKTANICREERRGIL